MKGKRKDRKKVGKIILLAMSFVMTVVLTFTITLAWFYDSDWASNSVTMAGSVGIELRDYNGKLANGTGAGQLHFIIDGTYAYPGQAVDVSASVFNNGGTSASGVEESGLSASGKGSACYVRAHFAVYTDIGLNTGFSGSTADDPDQNMNARYLYDFLQGLIDTQNALQDSTGYKWVYYQNTDAGMKLDDKYWYNGVSSTEDTSITDIGFFYLCEKGEGVKTLKVLSVGEESAFLWNDQFIIPWQLTNASADKNIFVGIVFQAVQTFIPLIEDGIINKNMTDNQVPAARCTYDNISVQTVFNSSYFEEINLVVNGINFGNGQYASSTTPNSSST